MLISGVTVTSETISAPSHASMKIVHLREQGKLELDEAGLRQVLDQIPRGAPIAVVSVCNMGCARPLDLLLRFVSEQHGTIGGEEQAVGGEEQAVGGEEHTVGGKSSEVGVWMHALPQGIANSQGLLIAVLVLNVRLPPGGKGENKEVLASLLGLAGVLSSLQILSVPPAFAQHEFDFAVDSRSKAESILGEDRGLLQGLECWVVDGVFQHLQEQAFGTKASCVLVSEDSAHVLFAGRGLRPKKVSGSTVTCKDALFDHIHLAVLALQPQEVEETWFSWSFNLVPVVGTCKQAYEAKVLYDKGQMDKAKYKALDATISLVGDIFTLVTLGNGMLAKEAVKQTGLHVAEMGVAEAVVSQGAAGMTKKAASEVGKKAAVEGGKQATQAAAKQATQAAAKQATQAAAKQATQAAAKQATQAAAKQTAQAAAKQAAKEAAKQTAQAAAKQAAKEAAKQATQAAAKQTAQAAAKQAAKEAAKQATQAAAKQAAKEAAKQAAKQAAKVAAEQAMKVAAEQAVKVAAEQAVKVAAEQAVKVAAEQAAKVAAAEVGKQTMKAGAGQTAMHVVASTVKSIAMAEGRKVCVDLVSKLNDGRAKNSSKLTPRQEFEQELNEAEKKGNGARIVQLTQKTNTAELVALAMDSIRSMAFHPGMEKNPCCLVLVHQLERFGDQDVRVAEAGCHAISLFASDLVGCKPQLHSLGAYQAIEACLDNPFRSAAITRMLQD
ncbi:hypothetical protein BASA81_002386 [Batrachochytrium salamandrivorans]|nr:hypothetical protein BASA81_002386 [Batrachochytrium salamandrivorans]